ncbi:ATP-binding protein [Phenylobacterium sp.]|uniref:two-component system sensor histidine kinase NtrB n=1 Tax=Phenylobacterium sp. TaxID=1871053 RepID=UPI0025EFCC8E|nr:ATP-binding protein [Phenylobacterium sp.]
MAQRLDALHRMSGALTHDFNNLLGVILSANERLAEELPEGSEQRKLALIALEAAERGAELLRRALTLAQGQAPDSDTIDAAEALATVRGLARQAITPDVRLEVREPNQAIACAGDRVGLEMALLNLCLNAGHATPAGGRVVVQAHRVQVGRSDHLGLTAGAYAAFSVRDTGCGMSPETLTRATDPLFTTKATGTGLGLSSVADFARSAGGALSLWSRPGQGTTATLYLPLLDAAPDAVAA